MVDAETWRIVEESSWRLGDRLLYVSSPFLRGDDIVALQMSLALLGFDPGRIDGIFGPTTDAALQEFQRNYGLEDSGTLTRATLVALERLVPHDQGRRLVTEVRQRAGLIRAVENATVILCGDSPARQELASALTEQNVDVLMTELEGSAAAEFANTYRGGIVVGIYQRLRTPTIVINYYESQRFRSLHGHNLAESVASRLGVETYGMATPLLRETTMTAIEIAHGPTDLEDLVDALNVTIPTLFHNAGIH